MASIAITSAWSRVIVPLTAQPSIRSFIRLRERRRVDLPQPEGPMMAVTEPGGKLMEIPLITGLGP
jgi:hypothetical protein